MSVRIQGTIARKAELRHTPGQQYVVMFHVHAGVGVPFEVRVYFPDAPDKEKTARELCGALRERRVVEVVGNRYRNRMDHEYAVIVLDEIDYLATRGDEPPVEWRI